MENNSYFGLLALMLISSLSAAAQKNLYQFKVLAGHTTEYGYNMYATQEPLGARIEQDYVAGMTAGIALGKMKENHVYREISLLYAQPSAFATYAEPNPGGLPPYAYFVGHSVMANFETGKYFQHPTKGSQQFFFGLFMQPQWTYYRISPNNSQVMPSNLQSAATRLGATPRFMLEVLPHWWLDFTCAIGLVNVEMAIRTEGDPANPSTSNNFDMSITPSTQLRMGLAYRFQ